MKNRLLLQIIVITVFVITTVMSYADSGNLSAAFIDELLGAKALSLGGAYTSLADDPLSMIWNPSGIQSQQSKSSLLVEHAQVLDFYDYSFIGYTRKLNPLFSLGIGFLHSGDEIMSESTGYIAVATDGVTLNRITGKSSIPKGLVQLGLTMKYYYASFGNDNGTDLYDYYGYNHQVSGSANGFGFDAGIIVSVSPKDNIGVSLKNFFNSIWWDSVNDAGSSLGAYTEKIPTKWTLGYSRQEDRWRGAIDITKTLYQDIEDVMYVGVEYDVTKEFSVRSGFSQELVTADNKKLSAGLEFTLKPAGLPAIDLSFAYINSLQWQNHNSVLMSILVPLVNK